MRDRSAFAPRLADIFGRGKRILLILLVAAVGLALIAAGMASSAAEDGSEDALEAQLEQMCSSLSGVGSCRVMVTYKVSESRYGSSGQRSVESVAVVCKGADKAGVRSELTDMLSALFGIGTNRIHISKMK